jgi:long-subunit fatty acid transport protein
MKKLPFIVSLLFLQINSSFAQNVDLGTWNILNMKYSINDKWSAFGEGQIRSLKFYNNFHYYEYKGGVNFKAHKNANVTMGIGSYQTFKEGGNFLTPKNNDELRIWPQITVFQSIGELKIEQRYRAEFRFTSSGYRNRFRYRIGVSYPFGNMKNNFKPYVISASNELFFTNKEPYFERNRIALAFNYKPSKSSTIQIGYIHQFDYKINDETGRDFLQIGYYIEFNRNTSQPNTNEIEIKDN